MPRLLAALLLLALPLPALAAEPGVVLLDWREGAFAAGAPASVEGANAASFPVRVGDCHRRLLVDLLYDPAETGAAVEGVGEAALLHTFRVELRSGLATVTSTTVAQPGYGRSMGVVPPGDYALRATLTQGAAVSWSLRLRGWELPEEPACLPLVRIAEVEANPPGDDAGAEWVEIASGEAEPLDLSGWELASGEGAPFFLPAGTVVPAHGRVVVAMPADAPLADEGASLRLARLGLVRDEAPALADLDDDARAWSRGEAGGWSFVAATPGS